MLLYTFNTYHPLCGQALQVDLLSSRGADVNGGNWFRLVEGEIEHGYAVLDALWEGVVGGCGRKGQEVSQHDIRARKPKATKLFNQMHNF